jgi:hypothetical protein
MSGYIELLSTEIPFGIDLAFRDLLAQVYGGERVYWLDVSDTNRKAPLSDQYAVLCGALTRTQAQQTGLMAADACYLVWLRHPVERVLAQYAYLDAEIRKYLPVQNHTILYTMERSLVEFARCEEHVNVQSKLLSVKALSGYDFVGTAETREKDLQRLAKQLGWAVDLPIPSFAMANERRFLTEPQVVEEIERLNAADMDLYNWARIHCGA